MGEANHPPPAPPGVLDHRPFLNPHPLLGLFARVKFTDGFARLGEGSVVAVHERLGHHGRHRFLQASAAELVFQRLLNLVAECALGVGDNGIEGHLMQDAARMFAAEQNEADLRPVPVGDDNAIAMFQQVGDVMHGFDHGGILVRHAHVLRVLDERVAADGDDERFQGVASLKLFARPDIRNVHCAATRNPSLSRRSRMMAM